MFWNRKIYTQNYSNCNIFVEPEQVVAIKTIKTKISYY